MSHGFGSSVGFSYRFFLAGTRDPLDYERVRAKQTVSTATTLAFRHHRTFPIKPTFSGRRLKPHRCEEIALDFIASDQNNDAIKRLYCNLIAAQEIPVDAKAVPSIKIIPRHYRMKRSPIPCGVKFKVPASAVFNVEGVPAFADKALRSWAAGSPHIERTKNDRLPE